MRIERLLAASLLAAMESSWAALGAHAPSPSAGDPPPAAMQTPSGVEYTHLQRRLGSGTTVHEYADARGIVFAVAWSGPFMPDLRELLGPHFAALTAQEAAAPSRGLVTVQQPGLVIVSSGRMRAFHGQAWLPRQLPAGFDTGGLP